MKVLLHLCCANCACYPIDWLRQRGHDVRGLFYNPNIQPYGEFVRRREAVEQLSNVLQVPVIFMDEYPLEEFFRRVVFREGQRCWTCYQWRLETAARVARRGHYDAFTTTLLFSKHQRHDRIRDVAQEEARVRGVRFLYHDFREGWKEGTQRARSEGFYRQSYCGCIYSERDRFHGAR
jgi:predicted adenine nucleotide alpha hydrolase (AANH) superfamily ATPase